MVVVGVAASLKLLFTLAQRGLKYAQNSKRVPNKL